METTVKNIQELSVTDRPREKLIELGPAQLSNAELIAIILGSGTKALPVMTICQAIIQSVQDNIFNLGSMNIGQIAKTKGIGQIKAASILAAIELGKRSIRPAGPLCLKEDNSVGQFIANYFTKQQKPQYQLILMNHRSELLATHEMEVKKNKQINLKSLMKLSLEAGATEIMLCRNELKLSDNFLSQEKAFIIQCDAAASMLKINMRGLLVVNIK